MTRKVRATGFRTPAQGAAGSFRVFRATAGTKARPVRIEYGFSTRKAGYPGFYDELKQRGPLTVPDQTHSANIHRVVPPHHDLKTISDCDALVTTQLGHILTVRTADCLPIFFWDAKGKAVAIAHAGWKGTHQKIAAKTVNRLKRSGVDPKDLRIVFGPSIRPCCYEVGPEFLGRFDRRTLKPNSGGRFQFDLVLANRLQLLAAGVSARQIRELRFCTACDTRTFFSFRRDPSNPGRLIHWIQKRGL